LRTAQTGLTATEAVFSDSDRHKAESGQAIVEWNVDNSIALRIKRDVSLPEQQGIEQFTGRRFTATTPCRQRFFTEMAFTGDLHLRGEGTHTVATCRHHRLQRIPTRIRG